MADGGNTLPQWAQIAGTMGLGGIALAVFNRIIATRDKKAAKTDETNAAQVSANLSREQMAWNSMTERITGLEKRITTLEGEIKDNERTHTTKMEAKDLIIAQRDLTISKLEKELAVDRQRTMSQIAALQHEKAELEKDNTVYQMGFSSAMALWGGTMTVQDQPITEVGSEHIQRVLSLEKIRAREKRQQALPDPVEEGQ